MVETNGQTRIGYRARSIDGWGNPILPSPPYAGDQERGAS